MAAAAVPGLAATAATVLHYTMNHHALACLT
jgi:hypothetical protein